MSKTIDLLNNLRKELKSLKQNHCTYALKTGTEVEDMGIEEIQFLRDVSMDIMPMTVKIGGPEARNDIRNCLKMKVDTILAPMIESVYALSNFVNTVLELSNDYAQYPVELAINIESIGAVNNFDGMLASSSMSNIHQVTIGRSDLSRSMHLPIDDSEVIGTASMIVKKINNKGRVSSLGGGLSLSNIQSIIDGIPLHRINSRHIVFSVNPKFEKNPGKHLYHGLTFEKELYKSLAQIFPERKNHYQNRESLLSKRMGNLEILESEKQSNR